MNLNFTIDMYFEIMMHLCKKMSIDISIKEPLENYLKQFKFNNRILWHGTIKGYEIKPMFVNDISLYDSCYRFISHDVFSGNESNIRESFIALCLGIKSFRLTDLNIIVINPFIGAKDILKSKSLEEAIIQADLWFPGDNSKQILRFISKKEKLKKKSNETNRYLVQ